MEYVISKHEYSARNDTELSISVDEVLEVLRVESGWAEGRNINCDIGWFPYNYVEKFTGVVPKALKDKKPPSVPKKGLRISNKLTNLVSKKPQAQPQVQAQAQPQAQAQSQPMTSDSAIDLEGESIIDSKEKTSTYLMRWLSSRASKAQLKIQGVWTGDVEPQTMPGESTTKINLPKKSTIYGVPLKEVIETYGGPIPPIVYKCVEFLRATSLKEQGLFRISGIASEVSELGVTFATIGANPNLANNDCHAVSGCLKKFFRDLPEPVFTFAQNDQIIGAFNAPNKADQLKEVFQRLPEPNFSIVKYLIQFLVQVASFSEVNKMMPNNLGIVFGPTLMRSEHETLSGFMDPSNNSVATVACIINNCSSIFGPDPVVIPQLEPAASASTPSSAPSPQKSSQPTDHKNALVAALARKQSSATNINSAILSGSSSSASSSPSSSSSSAASSPPAATGPLPAVASASAPSPAKASMPVATKPRPKIETPSTSKPDLLRQKSSTLSQSQDINRTADDDVVLRSGGREKMQKTLAKHISTPVKLDPQNLGVAGSGGGGPTAVSISDLKQNSRFASAPSKPDAAPKPSDVVSETGESKPPIPAKPSIPPKPQKAESSPAPTESHQSNSVSSTTSAPSSPEKSVDDPITPAAEAKPPIPSKPVIPPKPGTAKKEEKVRAIAKFEGKKEYNQLTLSTGDIITVTKKHESGWWTGVVNGETGLFPITYVKPVE